MTGLVAGITVPGVCRAMKVEPNKDLMWSAGQIVLKMYLHRYGALPPKDLRRKTYGGGFHCFAVYPEYMRKEIEKVIRAHMTEAAKQGDLFS